MLAKQLHGVMVFNATFNNISAISWRSVLLEKTLTCRKSLTNLINFSCDAWTPDYTGDDKNIQTIQCWKLGTSLGQEQKMWQD
jgi:hypothetical protein